MKKLYLAAETHRLVATLARAGWILQPGDRVLDIGCGSGGMVFRLRELGYEAYGFDIAPQWHNQPADRHEWYRSLLPEAPPEGAPLPVPYRLPFDDNHFDVIISTQVIEHVHDLDTFFAEAARVLNAEGVMLSMYSSSSCFIEDHSYAPLYTWWPRPWVLKLAAWLGVRNEFQAGMTADQVYQANARYMQASVFIRSEKQVNRIAQNYFNDIKDAGPYYYAGRPHGFKLLYQYIRRALTDDLPMRGLAYYQRMSLPIFSAKRDAQSDKKIG